MSLPSWKIAADLAVHRRRRADHLAAECLTDRLMAETDAQHRDSCPAAAVIRSRQMPASFGVQGPGDSTIASGWRASASATLSLSLRDTSQRAPTSPRKWTRLKVKDVVVVDQEDHGGASCAGEAYAVNGGAQSVRSPRL